MEDPIDNETTQRLRIAVAKREDIEAFTAARLQHMSERFRALNGEIKGCPDIDPPKQT